MSWPTVLLFIVVGLIVGWWWLGQPLRYKNVPISDFEHYFRSWIPILANDGLIFIREDKSKHFVQFALYKSEANPIRFMSLDRDGEYEYAEAVLHFGFPDAEWSSSYFNAVRSALQQAGFKVKVDYTETEGVPRFLECDLPATTDSVYHQAAELARVALAAIGHDQSTRFTVWSEGDIDPKAVTESLRHLTTLTFAGGPSAGLPGCTVCKVFF